MDIDEPHCIAFTCVIAHIDGRQIQQENNNVVIVVRYASISSISGITFPLFSDCYWNPSVKDCASASAVSICKCKMQNVKPIKPMSYNNEGACTYKCKTNICSFFLLIF